MTGVVHQVHDYPVSPQVLWDSVTDFAALAEVCRGFVSFEGLPEGRAAAGQVIELRLRLFGWLPAQDYRMDLLEVDPVAMQVRSHEAGAGAKSWRHTIEVTPLPGGARLTDHVEIEAGVLTPVYTAWARMFYRGRHRRRLKLLGLV